MNLLTMAQSLCGQTEGVAERFCREVQRVTQGAVQLSLEHPSLPEESHMEHLLASFPVKFGEFSYGRLHVFAHPTQSCTPMMPLALAHSVALICGWLLYTFEISALIQGQTPQEANSICLRLTRRQRQIVVLMLHGYDQDTISEKLCISPATVNKHRQNIYQELGVHDEIKALLVAYQAGLVSPLERPLAEDYE